MQHTLAVTFSQKKLHNLSQQIQKLEFRFVNRSGLGCTLIVFLQKVAKGQRISKCLFGIFSFFQKTYENTSHSSKNEFICSFFGRIHDFNISSKMKVTQMEIFNFLWHTWDH